MPSFAAAVWVVFTIRAMGLDGNAVTLFDSNSHKPVALVFLRTDCPISNRYAPELNRIYQQFGGRVAFYAVYADGSETAAAIQRHASEYRLSIPILRDPHKALVRAAKATVTPEAAVFSADGTLLYHGRIDNRYVDFGQVMPEATKHDLNDALSAAIAGKPVRPDVTRAIGCSLADAR